MYAQVIIDANHAKVDRLFDYLVPKALEQSIAVGVRVMVPFGQRNGKKEGYVLALTKTTQVPENKVKAILEVLDEGKPIFTPTMLTLAQWMKKTYFCTLNQCFQAIMPAGIRTKSLWYAELRTDLPSNLTKSEQKLFDFLQEHGGTMPIQDLEREYGGRVTHALQCLKEKKVIALRQKTHRSTYKKEIRIFSLTEDEELLRQVRQKAERSQRMAGQCRVLAVLELEGKQSLADLKEKASVTTSTIQTLTKKGAIIEYRQEEKRNVFCAKDFEKSFPFAPTPEQARALSLLYEEMEKTEKKPVLLHGVTGSGKTEIYMQLIQKVITQGKQAIVLVPEISLTPQIMERFISRFGAAVSVTHSRLSMGERLDQWKKARDGEISVMIGPRSALFTPFSDVGVIVMDESHESSYYSDITPKYHTRDVAVKLSELTGALLVMGSATPDMTSYYHAQQGEYLLLELKQRTKGSRLPDTYIVDMRKELEEGNRSPFSRQLQQAVEENLKNGQQTMLFLNRRGYATFISCRSCGEALTCPECNITYTYHAKENALLCHYCGRQAEIPKNCPSCGSPYIRYFGTGTEKIEEETKRRFPQARVLRMDLDTTMQKGSHARILEQFGNGQADILVGTQMIAKGHDFPNVTLVGIMAADLSLNTGGYAATETCFQLITQAAGRAGRDALSGRVYVQTYQPESHAVRFAAAQDYHGFYEAEIRLREAMEYPPFTNIFSVLISGEKEQEVVESIRYLAAAMTYYNQKTGFTIVGPSPAVLQKFRGEYRWQIFVKAKDAERLKAFVLYCVEKAKKEKHGKVRFHLSFNPQN